MRWEGKGVSVAAGYGEGERREVGPVFPSALAGKPSIQQSSDQVQAYALAAGGSQPAS